MMTRPTKYDDDGVRTERVKPGDRWQMASGLLALFVLVVGCGFVGFVSARWGAQGWRQAEVEIRERETEWFNRLNTQIFELAVDAIKTRKTLAHGVLAVNERLDAMDLDHHRACQRAADLPPLPQVTVGDRATAPRMKGLRHIDHRKTVKRGASDFYGPVRFYGPVEFLPEVEE